MASQLANNSTSEFPVPERPRLWGQWRALALLFAGWTAFGIFSANEWYLFIRVTEGREARWPHLLRLTLPGCWLWAAITIFVVWLVQNYPMSRRTWSTRLPAYLMLAIAATFVDVALDFWLQPWARPSARSSFWALYISQFEFNFAIFAVLVAVRHAVGYYRQARDRQFRAAQLEAQLARAQLQVLKMQLQPHFLFNALGAISELVHHDAERADRMISRLGDLLRLSIDNVAGHEVPLRQELEFVAAYLEIQRVRFDDRLVVRTCIAPDALDALVPSLSLQPLVENAVVHGLSPRDEAGTLDILARVDGDWLEVRIEDNGRGLPPAGKLREGIGLSTTRARLAQLYGDDHRFVIERVRAEGGTRVLLIVPLRIAESPATTSEMRAATLPALAISR
ncbi:MAG: histidine kinase [Gemmatimonadaceae bacterium]